MSEETDPMQGDQQTQDAYQAMIAQKMQQAVEEVRAERRQPSNDAESDPVMLGATGFTGGISSAQ